jgi:hypothetical protein
VGARRTVNEVMSISDRARAPTAIYLSKAHRAAQSPKPDRGSQPTTVASQLINETHFFSILATGYFSLSGTPLYMYF